MARLAVLAVRGAQRCPWHRSLEAAGHRLHEAQSVEALAREWPALACELLLIDQPRPLLALHRLQRRLSAEAVRWSRLPVLHIGPPSEICEGDFLLCHSGSPEPSAVSAATEVLLRLAACLKDPSRLPPVPDEIEAGAIEQAARRLRHQLLATVEQRDTGVPGHARRVEALAVALARRLGFDSQSLACVAEAALWHDIGKLAFAPGLLAQARSLTDEERRCVQDHAHWGRTLVASLTGDRRIAVLVAQHHERRDGSGYLGLKGEQIQPEARVIGIAEVWDALTSAQLYRPALDAKRALEVIHLEAWGEELAVLEEEVAGRAGKLTHRR